MGMLMMFIITRHLIFYLCECYLVNNFGCSTLGINNHTLLSKYNLDVIRYVFINKNKL